MISATSFKYARALADVAVEMGIAQPAGKDLKQFASSWSESEELRNALANPAFPLQIKQNIVREVAAKLQLGAIVVNLLLLLTERSRMDQLGEVVEAYHQIMDDAAGVIRVNVVSAVELSDKIRSRLAETLTAVTAKEVRLQYQLDAQLIGGLKLQMGSTVYDGSIRTELERLRQELSS
jgi:F-type H+-transporting ATPase subunit delta